MKFSIHRRKITFVSTANRSLVFSSSYTVFVQTTLVHFQYCNGLVGFKNPSGLSPWDSFTKVQKRFLSVATGFVFFLSNKVTGVMVRQNTHKGFGFKTPDCSIRQTHFTKTVNLAVNIVRTRDIQPRPFH